MALTMARPWKHPKTGILYLRQRTPLDLLDRLKRTAVRLPVAEAWAEVRIGPVVQLSLRTRDPATAKIRHVLADAALKRFWAAQRRGSARLTHKEAVALAGTFYRQITAAFESTPEIAHVLMWAESQGWVGGLDAKQRDEVAKSFRAAPHCAQLTDELLGREGLVVDEPSRELLSREVAYALADASVRTNRSFHQGDYSPDPVVARFPAWNGRAQLPASPLDTVTVETLFERWSAYHAATKAPSTIDRYGPSIRSLAVFSQGRDVRSLTSDDLFAWAEHRRDTDRVAPRTVNKNDLVAVSSLLGWATKHQGGKLLSSNPARGVALDEPKPRATRERTFRQAEITAILIAALQAVPNREDPTIAFAKRWCPWLAAYSGARILELTSLSGRDVRREGEAWVLDLTKTKGGWPRTVPLHEHLVEQGFIDFVRQRGAGPLFHDAACEGRSKTSPAELRAGYLARWVRKASGLADLDVDPNHGWRHTFKTIALGAGMPDRISDAITGHRATKVARRYETPSVSMMAEALAKFPRYKVNAR